MPTGYTADIKDGITFEQFAMACARAFGACITMKEDPADAEIPEEFTPSDYHERMLAQAKEALKAALALTLAEAQALAESEYEAECARYLEWADKNQALRESYEQMLSQVRAWEPPTPDHVGMKEFMESQILESIAFDCDYEVDLPKKMSGHRYLENKIAMHKNSVMYHADAHAKEIERTAGRNAWVKALRDSLKDCK